MGTLVVSRKQRLRKLENEIRKGMEEFYYTGMKLKEIRDDELYKEAGFTTWETYCRKRWEWSYQHCNKLITASQYRDNIPSTPSGREQWSERSVRELTRIPDKRQAARVAKQVIKEVEKNPDVKLTSTTVKKFVDADLGIKKTKPTPIQKDEGIDPKDFIGAQIGSIEGADEELRFISFDAWTLLIKKHRYLIKRLIGACDSMADYLKDVLDDH